LSGDQRQAIDEARRREVGRGPQVVWDAVDPVDGNVSVGGQFFQQFARRSEIVPSHRLLL